MTTRPLLCSIVAALAPLIALLVCWMLAPPALHAARTDPLLARGIQLFRVGEFQRSMAALQRARASQLRGERDGQTLAQIHLYIALNYTVTKRQGPARTTFVEALRYDPTLRLDPDRFKPEILQFFDEVRAGLRGQLQVTSDLPGARVQIDGQPAGRVPCTLQLGVGAHQVHVLRPDGGLLYAARVLLRPGDQLQVAALERTPLPDDRHEHSVDDRAGRDRTDDRTERDHADHRRRARRTRSFWQRERLWTWIAAGGAAVFAAAGIAVWAASDAEYADLAANYEALRARNELDAIDRMRSSIAAKDTTAVTLFVAAGVLVATSSTLLFLEGRPRTERSPRFSVAPIGPGIALTLRH